jgi:hypothetical protein
MTAEDVDRLWNGLVANPSPIVGAILALLGVALGLWVSYKKHRDDRELNLKKDIYIEMAEAVAALRLEFGASFATKADTKEFIEPLRKFETAVAKARSVAPLTTIKKIIEVQRLVLDSCTAYFGSRAVWVRMSDDADRAKSVHDECSQRHYEVCLEALRSGDPQFLQASAVEAKRLLGLLDSAKSELLSAEAAVKKQFFVVAEVAFDGQMRIAEGYNQVILVTRQELKIPLDAKEFLEEVQALNRDAAKKIQEAIANARGESNAINAPSVSDPVQSSTSATRASPRSVPRPEQ